jgi:cell pole-organizing protein PopZ
MSNPKGASNDPSMDDILKSIRKIISDDEARAQVGQAPADGQPRRDDVLLLTNPIEEPKPGASQTGAPAPVPSPRIDPVQAAEMPQPSTEPPPDGSLLGEAMAGAASSAFARLSQAVQDSVPAPSAPDAGPAISPGGKTVEELVKDMLRPMLKDWLDRNLPAIVERYVEREIVRLTRR